MVEIFAVDMSLMKISEFYDYLKYVPRERQIKIKNFLKNEDAFRSLIGDILIRTIVNNKYKIKNNDMRFSVNQYGKPFIENIESFNFNISHSGKWIVCVTDLLPVGIDVELIRNIDFGLAELVFTVDEYIEFMKQTQYKKTLYFYDIWTLKESYIKACGKGLSMDLKSFGMVIEANCIKLENYIGRDKHYFRQYNIDNNYKLSTCSESNFYCTEIEKYKLSELFKCFIKASD